MGFLKREDPFRLKNPKLEVCISNQFLNFLHVLMNSCMARMICSDGSVCGTYDPSKQHFGCWLHYEMI